MAEPIQFEISDNGSTQTLLDTLKALGLTGDEAIERLKSGFTELSTSMRNAADSEQLLNTYIAAGGANVDTFRDALDKLTQVEKFGATQSQEVATAIQNLGVAEQAAALKAQQQAAAQTQLNTALDAANGKVGTSTSLNNQYGASANTAAAATANLGRSASGLGTAATAAGGLAASATAATSAARGLGTAATTTGSAATGLGSAATAAGSATAGLGTTATGTGGSLGGLKATVLDLAAAFGVMKLASEGIHAIDAFDTLQNQLNNVVGAGKPANDALAAIAKTALATQLPLESVGKAFGQVYSAVKEAGGSAEQAATIVDNLSRVLKAGGVEAGSAARVLHDFSEGLANGSLGGQQLASILRQAGGSLSLLSEGLGVNLEALNAHSQQLDASRAKVAALKASLDGNTLSVSAAQSAVNKYSTEQKSLTDNVTKANAKVNDATLSAKEHATAVKDAAAATKTFDDNTTKIGNSLAQARTALNAAKDSQDNLKRAELATAEATEARLSQLDSETLKQKLAGAAFTSYAQGLDLGAGTIKGAFTNLETSLSVYLGQSGDANTATRAINTALNLLAGSLPVVVPLVAGLAAAFVAVKAVALATEIVGIIGAINPLVFAATALGAVALAIANRFGLFDSALKSIKSSLASAQVQSGQFAQQQISTNASILDGEKGITAYAQKVGDARKSVLDHTAAINDNAKAQQNQATVSKQAGDDIATAATQASGTYQTVWSAALAAVEQNFSDWYNTVSSFVTKIINLVQSALNGEQDAASAAAVPGARDGATFTVPGSSGVDSKLIAVSPGEHVTVQTPAQRAAGAVNDNLPKFRNGGIADYTKANVLFTAAGDNTTGYTAVNPDTYYTKSEGTDYSALSIRNNAAAAAAQAAADAAAAAAAAVTKASNSSAASSSSDSVSSGGSSSTDSSTSSTASTSTTAAKTTTKKTGPGYDSVFGVQKPQDQTGPVYVTQVVSSEQAKLWTDTGGRWVLNTSYSQPNGNGGTITAGAEAAIERKDPSKAASFYKFRDGGSFTVPGSGGTDSQAIQLAVSPGEQVAVQTPQQQRGPDIPLRQKPGTVVNFNVATPDANSFGKSKRQIQSDLRKQLARVTG